MNSTIANDYSQKLEQREHALARPGRTIGDVELNTQKIHVIKRGSNVIAVNTVEFPPALLSIIDEIIVNAADHKTKAGKAMTYLLISVDQTTGEISVTNNGIGMKTDKIPDTDVWNVQQNFGTFMAGTNFDDDNEESTTGGLNGEGAKATNVFSKKFRVVVYCPELDQRYEQLWTDNMANCSEPTITKSGKKEGIVQVTFTPDFARFNVKGITDDILSIIRRRAYDIAAFLGESVKVYFKENGSTIQITNNTFQKYVKMFYDEETPMVNYSPNDNWEIVLAPASTSSIKHVSMVNGIYTYKGGKHIDCIKSAIAKQYIEKFAKTLKISVADVSKHYMIYAKAVLIKPKFDSQTKERCTLNLNKSKTPKFTVNAKFFKTLEDTLKIHESISNLHSIKNAKTANDASKGQKTNVGVVTLSDATLAGTKKGSKDCSLIVIEGLSAKSMVISGLSPSDRKIYGSFPFTGKVLNVRTSTNSIIADNDVIKDLITSTNLRIGADYSKPKERATLRYGKLVILADQDYDGYHIKGLIINIIHFFWPELLKSNDFLYYMATNIVKVTKGGKSISFLTLPEFESWSASNNGGNGYTIKYYKGLGSFTKKDAVDYFKGENKPLVLCSYEEAKDNLYINNAFGKDHADTRKKWIGNFDKLSYINHNEKSIKCSEIIIKEFIAYAHYSCVSRAIPGFDGLKPSQRKAFHGIVATKKSKNMKEDKDTKVCIITAYAIEKSAYHHGPDSMDKTIIGMAQNFAGSNNVNFMHPDGGFGTRLMNGKDAASPRYIFSKLNKNYHLMFRNEDRDLLTYNVVEGESVEPQTYIPIVPNVLINGSSGVAVGYSTNIPSFHPIEVIHCVRSFIKDGTFTPFHIWFEGFEGTYYHDETSGNYRIKGVYTQIDDFKIHVTEIPVTMSFDKYKKWILGSIKDNNNKTVKDASLPFSDLEESCGDATASFIITFSKPVNTLNLNHKVLKLQEDHLTSNMNMVTELSTIDRKDNTTVIMSEFCAIREQYYIKRKDLMVSNKLKEYTRANHLAEFIKLVVEDKLVVKNRKRSDIVASIKEFELPSLTFDKSGSSAPYSYYLKQPISKLTLEEYNKLKDLVTKFGTELDNIRATSHKDMWSKDLDELETHLLSEGKFQQRKPIGSFIHKEGKKIVEHKKYTGERQAIDLSVSNSMF